MYNLQLCRKKFSFFAKGHSHKQYTNQIDVVGDGIYSIYNGDFNFDLTIDANDYLILDADIQSFNSGYIVTDLNGDGATDSSDFLILDGNIQSFVSAVILP